MKPRLQKWKPVDPSYMPLSYLIEISFGLFSKEPRRANNISVGYLSHKMLPKENNFLNKQVKKQPQPLGPSGRKHIFDNGVRVHPLVSDFP